MDKLGRIYEQFRVHANELANKIAELIHEGNVRRIIIKDEHGHTFMEIPLTVATVGVILAPILAAAGAIATVVSRVDIVVERAPSGAAAGGAEGASTSAPGHNYGATEDQVNMGKTVPQRTGQHGPKVEDEAGTGQHDSQGG